MSDTLDMYAETDNNELTDVPQTQFVKVQHKGIIKELDIDGKKISVVDPAIVMQVESTIRLMQQRIANVEQTINSLSATIRQLNHAIKSIQRELDNKVSYE